MANRVRDRVIDEEENEVDFGRKTIFDRLEEQTEEEDSARPVREAVEGLTDNIPEGPGGTVGEGNVIGYGGLFLVRTGQLAVLPIPGVRQPGFNVISHGSEKFDDFVRHTMRINAASRHVAQTVAEYLVAAPSNIDYLTGEMDTVSIEEVKQRSSFSTWEIVVDVADRGKKEA